MYVGRTGRRNVSHCQQQSFLGLRSTGGSCSTYNPGQKSLGQYCNIHIFLSFLGSLLKQCILFEILLQFCLQPPYTKLKLGKNSGYTRLTLFVGWGEGLDPCELENALRNAKVSQASLLSMIVVMILTSDGIFRYLLKAEWAIWIR